MASVITSERMFLLIFLTGLFYVSVASRKTIKLGVILPFSGKSPWTRSKIGPALEIAILSIKAHASILPDYEFVMTLADSKCSATSGPLEAIEMHCKQSAHVFFGPFCDFSLAPVARYAPSWNIPVITVGGMASAFDNKGGEYKLLTRMSSPYSKMAEAVEAIMAKFQWRNIAILYDNKIGDQVRSCFFQTEALYSTLTRSRTPYKIWYKKFDFSRNVGNEVLQTLLRNASTQSRSKYNVAKDNLYISIQSSHKMAVHLRWKRGSGNGRKKAEYAIDSSFEQCLCTLRRFFYWRADNLSDFWQN